MLLCDICGKAFHFVVRDSKKVITSCPLEPFKKVKSYYSPEFKGFIGSLFFDSSVMNNDPKSLVTFSNKIPKKTSLSDAFKINEKVYLKTCVIESPLDTFFLHFNRVLIDIFYNSKFNYVENDQKVRERQFNYLWLSPSKLRECYFHKSDKKFNSISELLIPELLLYPIGIVKSLNHEAWGKIVEEIISSRESEGKPTWIIQTKPLSSCIEVYSNSDLATYLNTSVSRIVLEEIDGSKEDITPDPINGKKKNGKKNNSDYLS